LVLPGSLGGTDVTCLSPLVKRHYAMEAAAAVDL
jgi:hypothetical protein